ncbi:MAG: GatB/YqeY domain-containing protein [Candidatus Saccharimonadales bacterium]
MALKDKIAADLKSAMLAKDEAKVTVLRGVKSIILDVEVAEGKRDAGLSDEEIEKLLMREVKKRKEAIDIYEANGRGDLVESEKTEKQIIESYLPKQLSESEISEKIDEVMSALGEGEIAQVGVIIGKVKMLVGSAADGATVARLVKEKIK